ncbi:diguanylate cyclase with GAF sensor [Malonomonas rubra DSM 5091]|uniref:diguanylate cyclase n=1 Tax=Malonomonas rubra DSM 5091 TaxID=1122189 RepID=A0A1M6CEA0_MALRU|nr:sensor domain-containing diguanylate cyclase [Malonomonas rubra]SHI59306.1 diguanylate cyclase with GAF sensor [Malonomonas rubra DSM 5091]
MFEKIRYANLSLLKKVLLPYILLLLTLAMAISFGSSMLLHGGLIDISKQRLQHIQQQAYADFKNIEHLLVFNSEAQIEPPQEASTIIEKALAPYDQHFHVSLIRFDDPDLPQSQRILLEKSLHNHSTYISVLPAPGQGLMLAAARRLTENFFLFLQHPLDSQHLDLLAERYEGNFMLLDRQGRLLAKSSGTEIELPALSEPILNKILSGTSHAAFSEYPQATLINYTALPLGHDSVFLLATSQSLSAIDLLISKHRIYLLAIIGLSLLVCITLFRSLLIRLFSPLQALVTTHEKVSQGDDDYRVPIEKHNHSQLTMLCHACNHLLDRISGQKQQITDLNEQLKQHEELKEHNRHLRKSNLELESRSVSLKEQNQQFSGLFKIAQSLVSSLDQQLLYERIIQALKDTLDCSLCVLYIFKPADDKLTAVKIQGLYGIDLKSIRAELGEGHAGRAALQQQTCYIADIDKEANKPLYGNEVISSGSLLSVPLTVQNRLIGVLNLHQNEVNGFSSTSQQIAQAIASQAAIAIENARLYEKTKTLSATDELTGLANRRQFQEFLLRELAQSRRQHNPFSILMIDIDHFKRYNDFHGHLKGDIVLKKVATLLMQNTRGVDLVARFGGEEFVLLLPKSDKESSLSVAEKLRVCIEKEFFPGADQSQPGQRLTISIGISHFPGDSSDIYDLMNLADTALYAAKKLGRNTCVGWSPELQQQQSQSTKKG